MEEKIYLTKYAKAAGCAAKAAPAVLAQVLGKLPKFQDENLLVGTETSDDAAVYRLTKDLAMIQTLDFFPPMVDDPYDFGRVAAANALSDVYAMGGEPKVALNIVAFPTSLPTDVLEEILRGGADKVREAGAVLAGGHTIQDDEPKYGLSVSGLVNPARIWTNAGAEAGDILILTKPLGVGILNTAKKGGLATEEDTATAVRSMTYLNKYAAEAMRGCCGMNPGYTEEAQMSQTEIQSEFGETDACRAEGGDKEENPGSPALRVHACTDVTGFSLAGHACEMARGSGKTIRIYQESVPVHPAALEYAAMGLIPGGAYRNRDYVGADCVFEGENLPLEDVFYDPQTSGGLLLAVHPDDAPEALARLSRLEYPGVAIGEVTEKGEKSILFLKGKFARKIRKDE